MVGSVSRLCTTEAMYTLKRSQYDSFGLTNFKTGSSDAYPRLYDPSPPDLDFNFGYKFANKIIVRGTETRPKYSLGLQKYLTV